MVALARAVVSAVVLGLAAAPAMAQDANRGRVLYETHCDSCHYERVHQRDRARSLVNALAELQAQVRRWAAQTGKPLGEDDLADIVDYLNRSHYRLEK